MDSKFNLRELNFREFFVNRKVKKLIVSMSQTLAVNYERPFRVRGSQVKAALKKLGCEPEVEEISVAVSIFVWLLALGHGSL